MRFFTTTAIAACTLVSSALAAPIDLERISNKIVNPVTFHKTDINNVALQIVGDKTVELGLTSTSAGGKLEVNGVFGELFWKDDWRWNFLEVDSPFMGYSQSNETKYGHLELASDEQMHLAIAAAPGSAIGQGLVLEEAAVRDDSTQLFQTFKLDVASGRVEFLGVPAQAFPNYQGPYGPDSQRNLLDKLVGQEVKLSSAKDDGVGYFKLAESN